MIQPQLMTDDLIERATSEAVRQGEHLRQTVRDITLRALQARELSLDQITKVVRGVTHGVEFGAMQSSTDSSKIMADALAGMDEALLKSVQASQIALQRAAGSADFNESEMKKALAGLENLEDQFLGSVRNAAGTQFKSQWDAVLKSVKSDGTQAGSQALETMAQFSEQWRQSLRAQREAGARLAHAFGQNFATLASGVLSGLTEAMRSATRADGEADGKRRRADP